MLRLFFHVNRQIRAYDLAYLARLTLLRVGELSHGVSLLVALLRHGQTVTRAIMDT